MGAYHGERGFLDIHAREARVSSGQVQRDCAVPAAVRAAVRGRARPAEALFLNARLSTPLRILRYARRIDAGPPIADLVADRARECVSPARRDRLAHRRGARSIAARTATSAAARSRSRRRCGRSASSQGTGSRHLHGTASGTWSSISACLAWAPCCTRSIRASFRSRSSTSSITRRTSISSSISRSCRCWRRSRRR